MAKQLLFPQFEKLRVKDFGGSLMKGNPREQRPISVKRPMHLVLRSTLATGQRSFLKHSTTLKIQRLVRKQGRNHGVQIYRLANSGNHLHLIIAPRSRKAFHSFIRSISGIIARATLGVERGKSQGKKFWDARPFTRILEWGKEYFEVCKYLAQNPIEALGFILHQKRSQSQSSSIAKAKGKPPPKSSNLAVS